MLGNFGIYLEKITLDDLPRAMKAGDSEIAATLSLSSRHMKHVDLWLFQASRTVHGGGNPGQLRIARVPRPPWSWRHAQLQDEEKEPADDTVQGT